MKKLVVLFILILMLGACLLCTSLCFADEVEATEDVVVEETTQEAEIDTSSNEAITWLKNTWEKSKGFVIGAFSGLSISLIVSAVVSALIKRFINKVGDKVENNTNSETIATNVASKMLDKWSSVSLDVNIKPLMERQYLELSNRVYADLDKTIKAQDEKYLAMVKCFEELSHYYDGSVGVTDEQRKNLADAIEYAKSLNDTPTKSVATIEVAAEPIKETKSTKVAENY